MKLGILFPTPVSAAPQLLAGADIANVLVEIHTNISSVAYGKNKTRITLHWMKSIRDTAPSLAPRLLLLPDFPYQHHGTIMETQESLRMTGGFWGIGIEAQE